MIDVSSYLTTDGAPLPVERVRRPKATSLVLVPPFLKHFGGPLAGPAYLKGAGERAGHSVKVLDLNEAWIGERIRLPHRTGVIKGDHDKPSPELTRLHGEWQELLAYHWPTELPREERERRLVALYATAEEVEACAHNLATTAFGAWARVKLQSLPRPDIVGLSVMFSGQVIAGLAITEVVKQLWPGVAVVWGGAHVTALADRIAQDPLYGKSVDGFVAGYAERTWVELLDSVAGKGLAWPKEVFRAGSGQSERAKENGATVPSFDLSRTHEGSLTLPLQASRGCAYGKCAFCTYPKIEGKYRKLSMGVLEPVIALAAEHEAVLSFKDSLLVPGQLLEVADAIKGRVQWSACTKLNVSFNETTMRRLAGDGLRTLEIGLETLEQGAQKLIHKEQSIGLFRSFLDAATAAQVAIVINYMTGLPGADPVEEAKWLEVVRAEVRQRPELNARVEHNTFQLEHLSPMGRDPEKYGLEVVAEWPWSSLLEFRVRGFDHTQTA